MTDPILTQTIAFVVLILVLVIWDLVWTLIGLWKSARNDQFGWFIVMGLINSLGIIPILYIVFFQKKQVRRKETTRRSIRR